MLIVDLDKNIVSGTAKAGDIRRHGLIEASQRLIE